MNYRDMGSQRSRNFKAFTLWMSLQVFGVDAFRRTGYAYMSTTLVYGRKVQRLCLNRHDATEEDLLETISRLEAIAAELTAEP